MHNFSSSRNWVTIITSVFRILARFKLLCWIKSWPIGRGHSDYVDKRKCRTRRNWINSSSGVSNWPSCYGETEYKLDKYEHAHTRTNTHTHTHKHTHAHKHTHTHANTRMHGCMHTHKHTRMHTRDKYNGQKIRTKAPNV